MQTFSTPELDEFFGVTASPGPVATKPPVDHPDSYSTPELDAFFGVGDYTAGERVTDVAKAAGAGAGRTPVVLGQALTMTGRALQDKDSVVRKYSPWGLLDRAVGLFTGKSFLSPIGAQYEAAGEGLKAIGKTATDYWEEKMSPEGRSLKEGAFFEKQGVGNMAMSALLQASESMPDMVAMAVAGAPITATMKSVGMVSGLSNAFMRSGLPQKWAGRMAEWVTSGLAYGSVEGIQAGLYNASEIGDEIAKMTPEQLRYSPKYLEYKKQAPDGVDPHQYAVELLRDDAEAITLGATAGAFVLQAPVFGAGALDRVLTAKSLIKRQVLNGLKEAIQEMPQEASEQVAENLAKQLTVSPGQPLTEGAGKSGLAAAGPAFVMGLVFPGAAPGRARKKKEPTVTDISTGVSDIPVDMIPEAAAKLIADNVAPAAVSPDELTEEQWLELDQIVADIETASDDEVAQIEAILPQFREAEPYMAEVIAEAIQYRRQGQQDLQTLAGAPAEQSPSPPAVLPAAPVEPVSPVSDPDEALMDQLQRHDAPVAPGMLSQYQQQQDWERQTAEALAYNQARNRPDDDDDGDGGGSIAAGQPVNLAPSDPQKEAGNYQKAHVRVDGLDISIENPIGSTRSGTDPSGRQWSQQLATDYGYIRGTKGRDKDHLDVMVKPGYTGGAQDVYIVNQVDSEGRFDEHKVVLGAQSEEEARALYRSNYEPGWDRDGSIVRLPMDQFRAWATSGRPARGPLNNTPYASTQSAPQGVASSVADQATVMVPVGAKPIRTKNVKTGTFSHNVTGPVESAEQAAAIIAPIAKSAQETVVALVLDKNGEPLSVVKHTVGGPASSQVFTNSLFGSLHNTPGAAAIWMGHNHPSGTMQSSPEDRALLRQIKNGLFGTGIVVRGSVIVGPTGRAMSHDTLDDEHEFPLDTGGKKKTAVTERRIEGDYVARLSQNAIRGSYDLERFLDGKPDGLLLLDNGLRPIDFLELTPTQMRNLRDGEKRGHAARIYRALDQHNTVTRAAINLTSGAPDAAANLVGLLQNARIDVVDVRTPSGSMADNGSITDLRKGVADRGNPFFSIGEDEWSGWEPSLTSTGKILGAPTWVKTLEDFRKLVRNLQNRVREGMVGRYWYENSAKKILEITNNNYREAEKLVQLVAIYSPQATVDVNTTFAVRAYNHWKNGKSEQSLKVKTSDQDHKARAVLYHDQPFDGRKTDSFYTNLMHWIIAHHPAARDQVSIDLDTDNAINNPVTADLWMYRAFGYENHQAGDDKGKGVYSFVENTTRKLTALLQQRNRGGKKWIPHQIQAAIWTAMKTRFEDPRVKAATNRESYRRGYIEKTGPNTYKTPTRKADKRAHDQIWLKNAMRIPTVNETIERAGIWGADFSTFINRGTMTVTWEAIPSPKLGHPILEADLETKMEFQADAETIILSEDGRDLLAEQLGVPLAYLSRGMGGYAGGVAPNALSHLFPAKPAGSFDDAKAEQYARAIQYIYKQDAVPWFRPDPRALLTDGGKKDARFRVLAPEKNGKRAAVRTFDTYREAVSEAERRGPGYDVRGGRYARGVFFVFANKIDGQTGERIISLLSKHLGPDAGFTRTAHNEVTIVNYRDDDTGLPLMRDQDGTLIDDEEFDRRIRKFDEENAESLGIIEHGELWTEGRYGYVHDWQEDPEGQQILRHGPAGSPDLHAWIRDRRRAFERLIEIYRQEGGPLYSVAEGDRGLGRQRDLGRRQAPDERRESVRLSHWSSRAGLQELDPAKHGTGLSGAESKRKQNDPENWVDRTYFGIEGGGYSPEPGLGPHRYQVDLPAAGLYDYRDDPDRLMAKARELKRQNPFADLLSLYERLIRDAGYSGYRVNKEGMGEVAAVYEKTMPLQDPLESVGATPGNRHSAQSLTEALRGKTDIDTLIDKGLVKIHANKGLAAIATGLNLGDGRVQGFYWDGVVHLVADQINRGDEFKILKHELGKHLSQELRGDKLFDTIDQLLERRKDDDTALGKAIRRAMARVPSNTPQDRYWREVGAYFAELAPDNVSLYRRLVARVKEALVRLGLSADILNADDINAIVIAAIRREARPEFSPRSAAGLVPDAGDLNEFAQPTMSLAAAKRKIQNLPAFKKWFGDSKVVDENGEPLVVYHGADWPGGFSSFKPREEKTGVKAAYFTVSPEIASAYAERFGGPQPGFSAPQVYPVYLSIKNPLVFDADGKGWGYANDRALAAAKKGGNDGVIIRNVKDGATTETTFPSTVYIAFSPSQIKSIFNQKWDGSNPDIMASVGDDTGMTDNQDQLNDPLFSYGSEALEKRVQVALDRGGHPSPAAHDRTLAMIKARIDAKMADQGIGIKTERRVSASPTAGAERLKKLMTKAGNLSAAKTTRALQGYEEIIASLRNDKLDTIEKMRLLERFVMRAERYTRGHVGIQSLPKQIAAARTDAARLKLIDIGIDRIERLNDDYIKRQSLAQIIRVIRKNSPKLRNSIEKQTSGGYGLAQELAKIKRVLLMKPAQVQAELERLNDLLLNNRMYDQAAEQRIDDLIAKQLAGTPLSKGEEYELRSLISDGTIGQLKRLTTYGMLKEASAAEALQALQTLKEMTYQKHLAWIDEIVQERQQRQRERNQMTEIITGGQALLDEEQRQQQQASRQNRWQWWKDQLRGYDDKMQSWEWLLDKLSRYSKSAALDSPLVRTFGRLVTRATRQEQTGIADQVATINLKMAEIFGATKGKLHNIVAANARIKTATGVYRYAGEQQLNEVALSQNQAYKRWMEWQDPTLREQLISQGYTEQTIAEIESFMTPEVRRWAEWQLREFYPGYRPGVNEVFRSLFFTDMPNNPNYSPIKRRYNRGEEDSNLLSRMNPHSSVIAGSVKQRVENSRDIELQDGDTVLMNHVTEMEHFKAWAQPMRQLRGVLGSEQVRDAIDQFHGPVAKQVLNGFMDDFARGKMYQREQSALVQYFRSAFTTAAIGANPVVFVKQLTSFPAFAMDMPAGQWVMGMSYLANPAEVVRAIKTLMSSEMMKDRYRSGFERDMILAMQSTAGQKLSATKNLANRLMILTKLGDGMAIIGGGWPVYKYHYKQQRKAGKSHDEAHAFAIERFDEIAERTQQAGSLKDLNAYQRGGPFAQLFTMFITAPSAYYRQWAGGMRQITGASKRDWVDAARGKNPKLLNGAKRVFITQVVLPTFFALATAAFEWDEDEILKGILLGPASGLFMLRDIGTALLNAVWGDKNWATGNTPVLSTLEEGVRVITRVSKNHDRFFQMDLGDLLADEQFLAVLEEGATVAGNLSGLPFGPAIRVGKGAADVISGETTAPVRRAMGFAESRLDIAKKRFDRIARDINATGKSHPAYRAMQRQKALLKRFDARMEKAVSRAERQRIHRERQNSLEAFVDEWK